MTFLPERHFKVQDTKTDIHELFFKVIKFIFLVAIFSAESRNILLKPKKNQLQRIICLLSVIVDTQECITLTGTNLFILTVPIREEGGNH